MAFNKYPHSKRGPSFTASMIDYLARSTTSSERAWQCQVALYINRHADEIMEVEGEEATRVDQTSDY